MTVDFILEQPVASGEVAAYPAAYAVVIDHCCVEVLPFPVLPVLAAERADYLVGIGSVGQVAVDLWFIVVKLQNVEDRDMG